MMVGTEKMRGREEAKKERVGGWLSKKRGVETH